MDRCHGLHPDQGCGAGLKFALVDQANVRHAKTLRILNPRKLVFPNRGIRNWVLPLRIARLLLFADKPGKMVAGKLNIFGAKRSFNFG